MSVDKRKNSYDSALSCHSTDTNTNGSLKENVNLNPFKSDSIQNGVSKPIADCSKIDEKQRYKSENFDKEDNDAICKNAEKDEDDKLFPRSCAREAADASNLQHLSAEKKTRNVSYETEECEDKENADYIKLNEEKLQYYSPEQDKSNAAFATAECKAEYKAGEDADHPILSDTPKNDNTQENVPKSMADSTKIDEGHVYKSENFGKKDNDAIYSNAKKDEDDKIFPSSCASEAVDVSTLQDSSAEKKTRNVSYETDECEDKENADYIKLNDEKLQDYSQDKSNAAFATAECKAEYKAREDADHPILSGTPKNDNTHENVPKSMADSTKIDDNNAIYSNAEKDEDDKIFPSSCASEAVDVSTLQDSSAEKKTCNVSYETDECEDKKNADYIKLNDEKLQDYSPEQSKASFVTAECKAGEDADHLILSDPPKNDSTQENVPKSIADWKTIVEKQGSKSENVGKEDNDAICKNAVKNEDDKIFPSSCSSEAVDDSTLQHSSAEKKNHNALCATVECVDKDNADYFKLSDEKLQDSSAEKESSNTSLEPAEVIPWRSRCSLHKNRRSRRSISRKSRRSDRRKQRCVERKMRGKNGLSNESSFSIPRTVATNKEKSPLNLQTFERDNEAAATNLIALRHTIYRIIHSSLDYEECAEKLRKMQLEPGQEIELCYMFVDCCAVQRTYGKFYGLLAERLCAINQIYVEPFEEIFQHIYKVTDRLHKTYLWNVSKFFTYLLYSDTISWEVLQCVRLNEDDSTTSSRIFIKILLQELAEKLGPRKLNCKLKIANSNGNLDGLFPKDNLGETRFAINFFESIGLGSLTEDLRKFLKTAPRMVHAIKVQILARNLRQVVSSSSYSETSYTETSDSSISESSGETSLSSTSESCTESTSSTGSASSY